MVVIYTACLHGVRVSRLNGLILVAGFLVRKRQKNLVPTVGPSSLEIRGRAHVPCTARELDLASVTISRLVYTKFRCGPRIALGSGMGELKTLAKSTRENG